jgi:hypothetical protein
MSITLDNVFGVSSKLVLSYVERQDVDNRFTAALKSNKQIVVYGSSKQGKTALVSKHSPLYQSISVSLSPKTELIDIYSSILRQANIRVETKQVETIGREAALGVGAKFKAFIPMLGIGEGSANTNLKSTVNKDREYEEIPFNLALPQDVSEILKKAKVNKNIILENFHYLNDDLQKEFAYDLRTFQDLGIRFIILGVWREKNKMVQFNGDLLDRITEIPVEPWDEKDFHRVAQKGANELLINFNKELLDKACSASFGSIGVFQEILKETCISAKVLNQQNSILDISSDLYLQTAINKKASDYSVRHQRGLEAIASGNSNTSSSKDQDGLFLPYYLVRVILDSGYDGFNNGMKRDNLHKKIQAIHHRPADVRASDMSNLLYNLAKLQNNKGISPPIIDFDRNTKSLQIVDSTFYFFLKNANLVEIIEELPNPLE